MARFATPPMRSSLDSKTVRPGLAAYSFYRADRRPLSRTQAKPARRTKPGSSSAAKVLTVLAVVIAAFIGYHSATSSSSSNGAAPFINLTPTANQSNPCAAGNLPKYIIVGIGKRHLWACAVHKQVYDTPAITGMTAHASTTTPTGTYKIYAKQTNITLTGSDEAGSWNDPVHYWMPFLDNQYGTYGFHDATWRPGNPFGKVSPSSSDASHGCVELPLPASAWLFNWADIGTPVAIEA